MNDTAGRERRAAARIDWQSMSAIDLLDAYMVALGTAIRRPASMIERSDEIRMELLRRLNDTDAASAAAGETIHTGRIPEGQQWIIEGRVVARLYTSSGIDDAIRAVESAEASGDTGRTE